MGSLTEVTPNLSSGWQEIAARVKDESFKKIPSEWRLSPVLLKSIDSSAEKSVKLIELDIPRSSGILSELELEITEQYSASELQDLLKSAKFSSVQVTTAFCKRAAIAQQLTCCLTETFFPEALERAKFLDDYLKREGKVMGPFHGLPISIKESFCMKGQKTTLGWVSWNDNPTPTWNSALVDMLLDMGAVLYVKTNIPQTMMTADSENNLFGRTLNPINTALNAGGSSGGEGSLIAFRGSILGVGTDIAGSIRIPALCCGVYGFKPTTNRVPFSGQLSGAMEGLPGLIPSAGPLAQNLDDLELFTKAVLNASPENYDSAAHAVPWRDGSNGAKQKLRIGVLPEEKAFPLHPPVRRALKDAIEALKAAGHEIILLPQADETSVSRGNRIAFHYYISGPPPGSTGPDPFEFEPPITSVAHSYSPFFAGGPLLPEIKDPYKLYDEIHTLKKNYSDAWRELWVSNKLDVVLSPSAQNTAVGHDTYGWPPYTQMWNTLDYPAVVFPYGKASKELDPVPDPESDPGPQPKYDADLVDGAPCSIQIITRRFEDEQCLAAAKIIEEALSRKT